MLAKLPIQEITRPNCSGICHAALNEQIPPDESPVIPRLYASLRILYFAPTATKISSRKYRTYRSLTVSYNVLLIESFKSRFHSSEYFFTNAYVGVPGESLISPGLMNTQIITGIFFCAIRLSITFSIGLFPLRSVYQPPSCTTISAAAV